MNKWKSIVLVLLLVLMVFSLGQPLFGQLRPFKQLQKLEQQLNTGQQQQTVQQQQVQLMPGLYIPHSAGPAPKLLELQSMMRQTENKPLARLDQQKVIQCFQQAAQAMNVPQATPDFLHAFFLSPSHPVAPNKGFLATIWGASWVAMSDKTFGIAHFDHPGQLGVSGEPKGYTVTFCLHAHKGLYLVNCPVDGKFDFFAYITFIDNNNHDFQYQAMSGQSDTQTGTISLAVYVPQNCTVDIIFSSPMNFSTHWEWNGCEVIPPQS